MTKDNTSHACRIRIGSLLVPLAHAAGKATVTMTGLRFLTDRPAISAVLAVRLCVSVVPALALLCAIVSILNYDLDPASLADT